MDLRWDQLRSLGLLSIAGLATVLAILWGVGLAATATGGSTNEYEPRAVGQETPVTDSSGMEPPDKWVDSEEEWMEYFKNWKQIVEAIQGGDLIMDDGPWKYVCYVDYREVTYTYDNVTLADLPEEKKRWFAFEGSLPYWERQLFLSRYFMFMTNDERNALWNIICGSPDFLVRYHGMSEEEKKAVWNSIIWNKTIPGFSTQESANNNLILGYTAYE